MSYDNTMRELGALGTRDLETMTGELHGVIRKLTAAESDAVAGGVHGATVSASPIQFPPPPSPTVPPIED
jgi:hypothetical protein